MAMQLLKTDAATEKRMRDFYRPKGASPSGQAYHWNSNAETYYLIGEAMGKVMLRLTKKK